MGTYGDLTYGSGTYGDATSGSSNPQSVVFNRYASDGVTLTGTITMTPAEFKTLQEQRGIPHYGGPYLLSLPWESVAAALTNLRGS